MKEKLLDLAKQIKGEFYTDKLMQALYATDASVYRELPLAVAIPKTKDDIKKLLHFASKNALPLIPRAAGTSLAGQCVGSGIVVDVSKYFTNIIELNIEEKWVRVQPGVVRDQLNDFLKPHGLFFGPNTSTANRCMIGGMVGNNSCGSTSIVYGSTRDHTLEVTTLLSDESKVVFKAFSKNEIIEKCSQKTLEGKIYKSLIEELSKDSIKNEILTKYPNPEVTRRNTGYAIDALLDTELFNNAEKPFNICKLLAGSEGTLAFTTEIKLNLVPIPKPFEIILAAHFTSIEESLKATVVAMEHKPTACELMDKTILDCTKDNSTQQSNRFFVEGDPKAILMIEFREDYLDAAIAKANRLINQFKTKNLGFAYPIIAGEKTKSVWDLRAAGLGLLANIPGDKKAVACIEDTAVAVTDLPKYINEFTEMMKSFGQDSVYYAHAGAGELHLRPILDLKKNEDVKLFREIGEASAKLVTKYGGSLSGEHGDGRVRAEFISINLGETIYQLLKRIKSTWDPNNIFNPGKIVDALPMHKFLRYEADVETLEVMTKFNFSETGGILKTIEKCNGSGDCRKLNFAGGTMCPSYRATLDEKDTTRGRANVLREFLTQNTKDNPFNHPEIAQAMELCISCKGCKSECPSNIDMATLKAEFQYQYNKSHKIPLRTKLVAHNARLNKLASKFPNIHNALVKQNWFKSALGIAKHRQLPLLAKQTFRHWFKNYKQKDCKNKVYFFCDENTNYYDVEIGIKAVKLLNVLGYKIVLLNHKESGRTYLSKGFLDEAKEIAEENISIFKDVITKNTPLIGIEPSTLLTFRDEYINLVNPEYKNSAKKLAENVLLFDEFLSREFKKGNIDKSFFKSKEQSVLLHGHCHQKALSSTHFTKEILSIPEGFSVEEIPSGCCGMAGAFGYEKEYFELSNRIGNMVLFPAINKEVSSTIISTSGTSCRHQIKDGTQKTVLHPIEVLYDALKT